MAMPDPYSDSQFELDPNKLSGYPSIDGLNPITLSDEYPYAVRMYFDAYFDLDPNKLSGYPSIDFIPEPAVQTYDFPKGAYYFMNDPFDNNPPKLFGYPSIDFLYQIQSIKLMIFLKLYIILCQTHSIVQKQNLLDFQVMI